MTPQGVNISEFQAALDDNQATEQTVAIMGSHVRNCYQDPEVRACAIQAVTSGSRPQSQKDIAAAVWAWCKRNIRFVPDEVQLAETGRGDERELLISPAVMARSTDRKGDCDCITMMADCMCMALGVTPLIKTYKCDRDDQGRWSHVCAAAILDGGAILPLDASHGSYAGWEVPIQDQFETQLWDMNGNKVGPSMRKGLSGYSARPGWTGSVETSTGTSAGPWWARDFPAAYGARARGLQAIAANKYGMGALDLNDPANADAFTQSITPVDTSSVNALINSGSYGDSSAAINTATGLPSAAINTATGLPWYSSLLGPLLGAGTQLGAAALGQNPTVIVPAQQPSTLGGISTSSLLLVGALIFGVVLISKGK